MARRSCCCATCTSAQRDVVVLSGRLLLVGVMTGGWCSRTLQAFSRVLLVVPGAGCVLTSLFIDDCLWLVDDCFRLVDHCFWLVDHRAWRAGRRDLFRRNR